MSTVATRVAALVERKPDGPDAATITAALIDEHMTTGQAVEEVLTRWEQAPEPQLTAAVLLPAIRQSLGLRPTLKRIVKTVSTPEYFRMETDAGTVPLGPASQWATKPAVFKAAFISIGEVPTLPKAGAARDDLFRMIARAAEPENIGEGATDTGWARETLRDYLTQRKPVDTLEEAARTAYPFWEGGRIVLFGPALKRWVLHTHQEHITNADLGRRLRAVGCEPDKINVGKGADRTSRGVWRLPVDWQKQADDEADEIDKANGDAE